MAEEVAAQHVCMAFDQPPVAADVGGSPVGLPAVHFDRGRDVPVDLYLEPLLLCGAHLGADPSKLSERVLAWLGFRVRVRVRVRVLQLAAEWTAGVVGVRAEGRRVGEGLRAVALGE